MKTINYKGKGEHSVRELELIIEQQAEELHLYKSGQKQITIGGVSQRSELLKAEDNDVSFDFYLDRFFEKPKIQLTYKNKRTKKYLLESKIISDYKRAMCL